MFESRIKNKSWYIGTCNFFFNSLIFLNGSLLKMDILKFSQIVIENIFKYFFIIFFLNKFEDDAINKLIICRLIKKKLLRVQIQIVKENKEV